ncbi:MAG TPA: hypothetical protein VGS11_02475 [Candidatus Bathyarchaeia archaeon]|nr:hypothetical protein [Candidatus Bathyarchaeia archaeon]
MVPEFFMVLGIFVFLAMSILSALLENDLPSILQYVFQVVAGGGLGLLLMDQEFVNIGMLGRSLTDPARFMISVVYLASAISIAAGINVYLAIIRRKMALSSILSGTVTVPTFMISAVLVSSFLATGGGLTFSPTTILILAVSAFAIGLSLLEFLRETRMHARNSSVIARLVSAGPVSIPSMQRKDDWEESPKKKVSEG